MNTSGKTGHLSQQMLVWLLSLLLAGQPVLPAVAATLTPGGDTQITQAGNGVPVVNIATPNAAGISHNTYRDYNVGKEGLILNNATDKLTPTQLGGLIQGNPHLKAGREARGIINEVTGTGRSQLQGYTEVAGKAANVMVANPYGITCNGCGFINTPAVTLTTGKPVFDAAGNLQALEVTRGSITLDGQGLDAGTGDAVSVIARATEINAQLHAKNITVIAGASRVGADGSIRAINGEGAAPRVAIDTGALGGMYANRIRLVSSEHGVGVNLGNLNARQGDITVEADGRLSLNQSLASGGISLSGQDIALRGNNKAGGTIAVSGRGAVTLNGGSVSGGEDVRISAGGALVRHDGALTAGRDISLSAPRITQSGSADAARDITVSGGDVNSRGALTAGQHVTVSGDTLAHSGHIMAGRTARVKAGSLSNSGTVQGAQVVAEATQLTNSGVLSAPSLSVNGQLIVNSGLMQGSQTLSLLTTLLENQQKGMIYSTAGFSLALPVLINDGTIVSDAALTLTGDRLTSRGDISAARLTLSAGSLSNSGAITGVETLDATLTAFTQQPGGTFLSAGDLTLNAGSVSNGGRLQADRTLMLQLTGDFTATADSILLGQQALSLSADSLINNGLIQGNGDTALTLRTQACNNGQLLSGGTFTLDAPVFINTGGWQASQIALNADSVTNGGTVLGTSGLTVNAGTMAHQATGALFSGSDVLINATGLSQAGQVVALGNITLNLVNAFTGLATLAAGNTLSVTSQGAVDNPGVMQGRAVNLSAGGQLSNSGRITTGDGSSTLRGSEIILSTAGSLQGGGDVALVSAGNVVINGFTGSAGSLTITAAGQLLNTALLYAAGNMRLFADSVINRQGDILAGNNLWIQKDAAGNAGREVINTSGNIETQQGDITINTARLFNGYVEMDARQQTLAADSNGSLSPLPPGKWMMLSDDGGPYIIVQRFLPHDPSPEYRLQTGDKTIVTVSTTGNIARISGGKNMAINATTLTNEAAQLLAQGDISLQGATLQNQSYQEGTAASETVWTLDDSRRYVYGAYDYDGYRLTSQNNSTLNGAIYRAVIQAAGSLTANFTRDISNTATTAGAAGTGNSLNAPTLTPLSNPAIAGAIPQAAAVTVESGSSEWFDGRFVNATDPDSPYLYILNPQLSNLGQVDPGLFGDLYALLGMHPGAQPRETRPDYTDQDRYLGSAWFMARLGLNPSRDYRFLGDAAFDTRYVSNAVLNQTGSRYISGLGSDLEQMRYLMDSAAAQQQALGLRFGVALTAAQVEALDHSLLWWESASISGRTVMVPKVYLSPKDITLQNGSVISGNGVRLAGGNVTSNGSITAQGGLSIDSRSGISNLNGGLMHAGGSLALRAQGDINNIGSTISGNTVQLESVGGSISNITRTEQWNIDAKSRRRSASLSGTTVGDTASIIATDSLAMTAGKDIRITGANVAAGGDLAMQAGGDISIAANRITASESQSGYRKKSTGEMSTTWQGSRITAGGDMAMLAGHDLAVTASGVSAGGSAQLAAGNDISLNAGQTHRQHRTGKSESHSTGVQGTTVSAGNDIELTAGRDISAQAAGMAAEENVTLQAGRDVNLRAAEITQGDSYRSKNKTVINESVRRQGTDIASGGDTTVIAGRDVNAHAAQVTTQGDLGVAAGRDVNLTTATESDYAYREETKTKSGFLSKKTTHTIQEDGVTREAGTLLSGDNVSVTAGHNLQVKGSSVVGDGDVTLNAGNRMDIVAATDTDTAWRFKEEKKRGLSGTGGIGFSIGTRKSTHDLREAGTTQSQSVSTIGSTGGSVSMTAGGQAHIGGADVIAAKAVSVTGDSVVITPGQDRRTRDETFEQKSSGLTLALSGAVGGAINNAVSAVQAAKESGDSRLAALQASKAALSGVQAAQGVALDAARGDAKDNTSTLGVSASLTTQKSTSEQHTESRTVAGSTLSAGNTLSLTATGKNQGANSGDILVAGSQLKAGGDTTLEAQHDILLTGGANTQQTRGKNSSSGGGIGVGIGAGTGGTGVSVFANVNRAKGHEKGDGTTWTETSLDSGGTLSLISGRDTTLNGAQMSGHRVVADVGRDLTLASQQDSSRYDSKQSSVAAGGSFTFGSMTGSGYISTSQDRMKSRYDSVQEQSGIFAGQGGFDITVGNHTQLDGAVIASTATADNNRLDTGTLGWRDIDNEADYKVSHSGISLSGAGSFGGQFSGNMPGGMVSAGGSSGHAEGTSQAAISNGSVTVRDRERQQQDVAGLSRDTDNANGSIGPIFDKEKEQNRLAAVQLIGELGFQAMDIARTQGEISATRAAKDPVSLAAAQAQLSAEGKKVTREAVAERAYNNVMSQYGTGSDLQRGIQAATAAIQGLSGGNIGGALAGGAAPYLAEAIGHRMGLDGTSKVIAHAIAGAAIAAAQGRNAGAGAAGASAGELSGMIALEIYGKPAGELGEDQKQTISTLATLAAGLAGGVVADSTAGAAAGAQVGKNAVENNYLSSKQIDAWSAEMKSCQAGGGDCSGIVKKYEELSTAQQKQLISDCATSPTTCQQKYGNVLTDSLAVKQALDNALGEDIPIKMVYDLTATWAHQMQAEGVVATNTVSKALQKEYGLDPVQAGIVANAAAAAFGGVSKVGKPNYTLNKDGAMLGINGPTVPSKTLWMGKGKERIDVENPAPGKRAGQIHYQDNSNNKYYYDPVSQTFPDAPKGVNDKLKDPAFKNAVDKGMTTYLGEK